VAAGIRPEAQGSPEQRSPSESTAPPRANHNGGRHEALAYRLSLLLALLVALALRLPVVTAGYPYLNYIDEGHVLRPTLVLLATGVWEPRSNNYPALPIRAIAGAARCLAVGAGPTTRPRLERELAAGSPYYNVIEPRELVIVARVISLLVSLGIVLVAGLYARRLAGVAAGAVAAFAAALVPALVIRGAIVAVDGYATLFVLAALACCGAARHPRHWLPILASGAFCGLAAVSKYPAGLSGLAVVVSLGLAPWRAVERLRAVAVAATGGLLAAAAAMPQIVTRPGAIWERILFQRHMYGTLHTASYWDQALRQAEWDLPFRGPELGATFAVLATLGLVVALGDRRWRREAAGWIAFAVPFVAIHARFPFQAFRNLLPLTALGCVTVAVLSAWVGERLRRPSLAAATAVGVLGMLFGFADVRHARERAGVVDSRRLAIDWLAARVGRDASLLVLAEVPIAPSEIARLGRRVRAVPWKRARAELLDGGPRFALIADLVSDDGLPLIPPADRGWLGERYDERSTFGSSQRFFDPGVFPGNDLRVVVLERRVGARRLPPPAARSSPTSSATGANSSSGKFSGFSQNSPRPPAPHRS
jgi:hypothetical protein